MDVTDAAPRPDKPVSRRNIARRWRPTTHKRVWFRRLGGVCGLKLCTL